MIYRRVTITISELTRIVKFVLVSEIPVLRAIWCPKCVVVDHFAFKIPRVKFLLDADEWDRLCQKYDSDSVLLALGPREAYRSSWYSRYLNKLLPARKLRKPVAFIYTPPAPADQIDHRAGMLEAISESLRDVKTYPWNKAD